MKPDKPKSRNQSIVPSAMVGDEIFFHHGDAPCCGKVLSVGKHGATVEHEGKRHRVEWGRVLGHKKRSEQKFRILHEGEDGMIVEDSSGKRRFVRIPQEARDGSHLAKSDGGYRLVTFVHKK
jgi:hypothetical protein